MVSTKKLKPPHKADVANWVSDGIHQLQDRPDMIINLFGMCGISDLVQLRPSVLLAGQQYPDSEDETEDNSLNDLEEIDYDLYTGPVTCFEKK